MQRGVVNFSINCMIFLSILLVISSSSYALFGFTGMSVKDSCNLEFIMTGKTYDSSDITLYENTKQIDIVNIKRNKGDPKDQSETISYPMLKNNSYSIDINLICGDKSGANPLFLKVDNKKNKLITLHCNGENKNLNEEGIDITEHVQLCFEQCRAEEEICDNIDNDCDGEIDEELFSVCGDSDIGTCELGKRTCQAGKWGICIGEIAPDIEICNGLDDDCDGKIDEELTKECSSDVGECSIGVTTCSSGEWSDCSGILPKEEICDELDNDCDGETDENCDCTNGEIRECGTDIGECSKGKQECINGEWDSCKDSITPVDEICDGLDNNCNGETDENLKNVCGESDVGICKFGTQSCISGELSVCEGAVFSDIEKCNGLDDDCDGEVDESLFEETNYGLIKCVDGEWIGQLVSIINNKDKDFNFIINEDDSSNGNGVKKIEEIIIPANEKVSFYLNAVKVDDSGYPIYNLVSDEYEFKIINDNNEYLNIETIYGNNVDIDKNTITLGESFFSVRPILECVKETIDGFTAYFGYKNKNDIPIQIPIGEKNKFTPEPKSRGQPEFFSTGRTDYYPNAAFSVNFNEDNLVWTLEGPDGKKRTSTASKNSIECKEQCSPTVEVCDGIDNDCDGEVDEELERKCGCDCSSAKVLMILDDNNNNEDLDDFTNNFKNLKTLGIDVTKINEPSDGITWDQIKDYNLIWLSNPGWPMDDIKTLENLKKFYNQGKPVVMQGDDMTWSQGFDKSKLESFTGLKNINNGLDGNYIVNFKDTKHPLLNHLRGRDIIYNNDDIDTSVITGEDIEVIASGEMISNSNYNGPAIIVKGESNLDNGILILTLLTLSKIEPESDALTFTANIINWLLTETQNCVCGPSNGICQKGKQTCESGKWSKCIDTLDPTVEICDGVDNDCDGNIDEELEKTCSTDIGQCSTGKSTCSSGEWSECSGNMPQDEICDGVDNDCDGNIDEELEKTCSTDIGECSTGKSTCSSGEWSECSGNMPQDEICDGVDNDCDGTIDEGCNCVEGERKQCGIGIGACAYSEQICVSGQWSECSAPKPTEEICDGIDNDCDVNIDENITKQCGTDIGMCQLGESICIMGNWSNCNGSISPIDERCSNSLDDDCDGYVDEGCSNPNKRSPSPSKPKDDEKEERKDNEPKEEIKNKTSSGGHIYFEPEPKPSAPSCKGTEKAILSEVTFPGKIDITDEKFNVVVKVKNPTDCPIYDIPVNIKTEEGWISKSTKIEHLSPTQTATIVFDVYSGLCSFIEGQYELYDEKVSIDAGIYNKMQHKDIPLNIPVISTIVNKENIKNNRLDTCFIINNKNREDLEIEFAISDRKDDILFDYISPIITSDKILIRKVNYPINIVRKKDYNLRTYLYEGGRLFSPSYLIADSKKTVDLSQAEPVQDWFTILIKRIFGGSE